MIQGLKRSPEWLAKQLLTIGSSAAGIIAGETPREYGTPVGLYEAMLAAKDGRITEKDFTDDMKRGLLTEPLHRLLLENELGEMVQEHDQEQFLYRGEYWWAHALPDGWVYCTDENRTKIPVQLKCPRVRNWHKIRLHGVHSYWLIGSQHTLAITGAPYEIFSVLNPETMQLLHYEVPRDEKVIAALMDKEREFFENFERRVRPLEEIMPDIELPAIEGQLIELEGEEAAAAETAYAEASALVDDAQALKDEAKKRLISLMGNARAADLPGGWRFYRTHMEGRKTYDHYRMQKDGFDLSKYEKRGAPYEIFRGFPRRRHD